MIRNEMLIPENAVVIIVPSPCGKKVNTPSTVTIDGECYTNLKLVCIDTELGYQSQHTFIGYSLKSEDQLLAEESVKKAEEALRAVKEVLNKVKEK